MRSRARGWASSTTGGSSSSRSGSSSTPSPASRKPNRAPFDFPEAEQELVAGYNTEYSSVRFALFPQAEYINMATMSGRGDDLYLGGWHGLLPIYTPLDPLIEQYGLGWAAFLAKVGGFLFFYIWMRWTLPRYRYDQLMSFGWKFLLPASVVNLIVSAAVWLYFNA
jgi:NADH-quinone oxidoreductase subunit H